MGSQGCKFLAQGNWPKLEELSLCSNKIRKVGMQSERRDTDIFPRQTGLISKQPFLVHLFTTKPNAKEETEVAIP